MEVIHYLDDFLFFEGPGGGRLWMVTCGVPIAAHKTEGPMQVITFLVDTRVGEVRLPKEKLTRLQREIRVWDGRRSCTKRELLSLIGQLQHASSMVRPGRTFLRRMITLSAVPKELHHRVRLNAGFRSDLAWWNASIGSWNGRSMMLGITRGHYKATITSDASGSWGCGAYSSLGDWFQLEWPKSWRSVHITIQELLPVVVGVVLWGDQWQDGTIRCRCDNAALVAIVNTGTCKSEKAIQLLRSLWPSTTWYYLHSTSQGLTMGQQMLSPEITNGPSSCR